MLLLQFLSSDVRVNLLEGQGPSIVTPVPNGDDLPLTCWQWSVKEPIMLSAGAIELNKQ
jgi:hypothetical protein